MFLLVVLKPFFNLFVLSPLLHFFAKVLQTLVALQHFISGSALFISPPAMDATGYRRKSSLKANMNKDFLAEDLDINDMQEEEEEERFPDDEKRKKACLKRESNNGGGGGVSRPSCQVEKCGLDLSDAKRYHRRHKVCEIHAKAPIVVVAGIRQRFCQQCSRFHELSEFDEAKRSCRRRLAGHNERRRKNSAEASAAEGSSSRKGLNPELKESHWRHADGQRARLTIVVQGSPSFKRSQIR